MYERFPTAGASQEQAPADPAAPPRPVVNAVRLMYAGAALSALVVIVSVATAGSLRSAILAKHPDYSSAQIHQAEVGSIATLVLFGLIAIGLWLWMAWANRRGRGWARIVCVVLFVFNTLNLLGSFLQVHAVGTVITAAVVWLVGLGAIVFLYSQESTAYFRGMR